MPTFNSSDSGLNRTKCFENTPPTTLNNNLLTLPADWLTILENKLHDTNPNLAKNIFLKHIGDMSHYKSKKFLTEQLSLLYHRISGNLDAQLGCLDEESYQLLILGLTEEISRCTEGFHIRVNNLVNSISIPQNLDQLLYLVRKAIVQEIASTLTHQDEPIYQVHVADRVLRIAKKLGLGLTPNIKKDQYTGSISEKKIRQVLTAEFPKQYTPLTIPFLLTDQLKLILNQYGYVGARENGYTIGSAENILEIIKCYLINSAENSLNKFPSLFILDQIDEFDEPTRIYDINWNVVRQLFFQTLIHENYFSMELKPNNLIEFAYFQALVTEKNTDLKTLFISQYIRQNKENEFIDHLLFIHDKFPDYWKDLIQNTSLVNQLDTFLFFINVMKNNYLKGDNKALLKKEHLIYTLLFEQNKKFILDRIFFPFPYKKILLRDINFELLLKSIRYRPELTEEYLNLFLDQENASSKLLFNLLNKRNQKGWTLLMVAARYNEDIFELILKLCQRIDAGPKQKKSFFLLKNNSGWNFLSLAVNYQPSLLITLFDFFKKNTELFDLDTLENLFYTTNNSHWHFLDYLARYRTERYVNLCLDFINHKFVITKDSKWLSLILNGQFDQLLRFAAQSNLNVLKSFFRFLSEHFDKIDSIILWNYFLKVSENNWNCLHTAARYWQNNLSLTLQFINSSAKFSNSFIRDLFLAQTSNGDNFLMLAAFYQPDSTKNIIEFMQQEHYVFNNVTLKNLFLQQNSDGWNFLSAAHNQPDNIQLILNFMEKSNKFDNETLQQIIFQKNKNQHTFLHLTTRFRPESTKIILDLIDSHIDSFADKFEQLLLVKNKFEKNLLLLSLKHQPDSVLLFLNFLNRNIDRFVILKNNTVFKQFVRQGFFLIQDPELRKNTFNIHHDLFFPKSHCLPFFSPRFCSKHQLTELEQQLKTTPNC